MDKIDQFLTRYIDTVYPSKEALEKVLQSGKKLKIYIGIDPTGTQLHLGHSTNFLLLRKFQDADHKIILLVGDFTARIGDPTDKTATRIKLTKEQIMKNCQTYKEQASKILDFEGKNSVELHYNSKWLENLAFKDLIELASNFTFQQMIERDMFQERIKAGKPIYLHEFFYPLMQGYDSVMLDVDMEVGGTDQTFNMLCGRTLMKALKGKEKFVLTTPLLINPKTGKKLMNKSEGNYVALNDAPNDVFSKVMALPDEAILPVLEMCTKIPSGTIEAIKENLRDNKANPMDIKKQLAREIVTMYHSKKAAKEAEKEFERVVQGKQLPSEIPTIKWSGSKSGATITDAIINLDMAQSRSEAKRLIEQGGVKLDDKIITDPNAPFTPHDQMVVRVGKRKFVKIIK